MHINVEKTHRYSDDKINEYSYYVCHKIPNVPNC